MSLKSKRHFPLLFAASAPYLIKQCYELLDLGRLKIMDKIFATKLSMSMAAISLAAVFALKASEVRPVKDPFTHYCGNFPCGAVEYLKLRPELQNKKLFNLYDWGGYLSWTLPQTKTYIDGRFPQHMIGERSFVEEYDSFFEENRSKEKLDEYGFEMALLKVKEGKFELNWFEKFFLGGDQNKINETKNHLKDYLEGSPEWNRVFADDLSAIYVKK